MTEDAISLILDTLQGTEDSFGKEIAPTWFVRADNQLEHLHGDCGYLLERYNSTWKSLLRDGHEIGWHPHIYRMEADEWHLETRDDVLEEILTRSHSRFLEFFDVKSVRMGESFHSNGTMGTLDKLGLLVDSTALPGRKRDDIERFFDWTGTPEHPYHPSINDYRVPGDEKRGILEVPMTMVETEASYDAAPLTRYLNLSFYNSLMTEGIKGLVGTNDAIVTVTHPYEIWPSPSGKHQIVSFDINEMKKNMNDIIERCNSINRPFRFITMSETRSLVED